MKKKFLTLALIAMTLGGTTAIAQNPNADNSNQNIENVKRQKGDKKGKRPKKNPYEGLTLTDAQKAQLERLDSKRMESRRQQKEARRQEKQRMDSVRREARKAEKLEYLQEVKEIIGPDQYMIFLENFYVGGGSNKPGKAIQKDFRDGKKGFDGKKDFDGKKMKKDKKGDRGEKRQGKPSKEKAQA